MGGTEEASEEESSQAKDRVLRASPKISVGGGSEEGDEEEGEGVEVKAEGGECVGVVDMEVEEGGEEEEEEVTFSVSDVRQRLTQHHCAPKKTFQRDPEDPSGECMQYYTCTIMYVSCTLCILTARV